MHFNLLRLVLVLASGLPLLAPPGWACRSLAAVGPLANERLPVNAHSCPDGGAMEQPAPAAPQCSGCAACCSSLNRATTPLTRSPTLGEISTLGAQTSLVALVPDFPGALRSSAFDLPIPSAPLQLLHCLWLC